MKTGISERKIKERIKRKTNPYLIEAIRETKGKNGWGRIRILLSSSTRKVPSVNLFRIDNESSEGDTIVVPGKVLSEGEITKKIRVCALSFSEKAIEKLKYAKSEIIPLIDEIRKNPRAEGIKILK